MNAYHVLAKISYKHDQLASNPEQTHFFIKAPTASKAVALAEDRTVVGQIPEGSVIDKQFIVKEAINRSSTGLASGEEIYSL